MNTTALPKPYSLRLPTEVDEEVRSFASTLRSDHRLKRPPINRALVQLVVLGLKAARASRKTMPDLSEIIRELDPSWSGNQLRDIEPIKVLTKSGNTPLDVLLESRRSRK